MNRAEKIEAVREKANRAAHPEVSDYGTALCRICGVTVPAQTGTKLSVDWPNVDLEQADKLRAKAGKPLIDQWSRAHLKCIPDPATIIMAITGRSVTPMIAGRVFVQAALHQLPRLTGYQHWDNPLHHDPTTSATPYAWLTEANRAELTSIIDKIEADSEPGPCTSGGCAWCGISESIQWHDSPFVWRDGSAAPLCHECDSVWAHYEGGVAERLLSVVAQEALVYAASNFISWGVRYEFHAFWEVADTAEAQAGYPSRWTYRAAVQDALSAIWTDHPECAPEARQSEFVRRAREREAARRAALAAESVVVLPSEWEAAR